MKKVNSQDIGILLSELHDYLWKNTSNEKGFMLKLRFGYIDQDQSKLLVRILDSIEKNYEKHEYFDVTQEIYRIPYLMCIWSESAVNNVPNVEPNDFHKSTFEIEAAINKIFDKYRE